MIGVKKVQLLGQNDVLLPTEATHLDSDMVPSVLLQNVERTFLSTRAQLFI